MKKPRRIVVKMEVVEDEPEVARVRDRTGRFNQSVTITSQVKNILRGARQRFFVGEYSGPRDLTLKREYPEQAW